MAAHRPPREPADWAGRLLPRSILGMTALLLSAALGAAFSGTVLYAYYEYRLDSNESRAEEFAARFADELDTAVEIINAEEEEAKKAVRDELAPLRQIAASGETLERLRADVAGSIFFVTTLAEDGRPSVGTAFAVFSDAEQSFLLTSYNTIRASTQTPAPPVRVRQGGEEIDARVQSVDPERDLALLSIDRGNVERIPWAEGDPSIGIGERVFSVSGLGAGGGGAVSQGLVGDVSAAGVQHDAPVGPQFQGAPLLNSNGEVVGVSSRAYAPLGFETDDVWFAPLIRSACERVLSCP